MNVKKKIILTGSVPPPFHGSSIYFNNLLNSEIRNEFEITHFDISDHRSLSNLSRLDFTNVEIALKNIFQLISILRKVRPDIVYIPVASNFLPYFRDGMFILITSWFSDAQIIIHLHEGKYFRETFYEKSNFVVKYFIRTSLKKVDTAIVLSKNFKDIFKGLIKKIVACPNGIKDDFTNSTAESNKDKIVISFLGNLFESKGVIDVIKAAVIVLRKHNNAEFRFAGAWKSEEDRTRQKALQIINENNIGERVILSGIIGGDAKKKFLTETDILVFPSWYKHEGFPLVILEAMSAGKPVISTIGTGAIEEMVLHDETGLLVEIKDPEAIAASINRLIENYELRKSMGMKGRKRFEENFTLDKNIKCISSIFRSALTN